MRSCFELSNGVQMPKIGFGTYKSTDGSDECVISQALEAGYRLLDTAAAYKNEEQVGKAITRSGFPEKRSSLPRKYGRQIWVMRIRKKAFRSLWKGCRQIIWICFCCIGQNRIRNSQTGRNWTGRAGEHWKNYIKKGRYVLLVLVISCPIIWKISVRQQRFSRW